MAKKRNYAAEYAARMARGKALGYSKSVARGKPKKGEVGLRRAKEILVAPGTVITGKGRKGFRPTYAQIRRRLKSIGLPLSEQVLRGKKGRTPRAWFGKQGERYLRDDPTRDNFIEFYTRYGLTEHEAYTLWFSP